MTSSSAVNTKCNWCGMHHIIEGRCPEVKALEWHPDGTIKRVEFVTPSDILPRTSGGELTNVDLTPTFSRQF